MRRVIRLLGLFLLLPIVVWAAQHGPITLAWDAVTLDANGNATTILYYNVRWGTSSGQENSGTQAATTICTAGTCQFTIQGLNPQQNYWFVITGVNAQGESAVSNEVTGRPSLVIHR